ncbi:MAG TPA: GIY-YIG nuclease family protein [Candidatus Babeliales bacterium]|nr:GIY-YIG nuclease family protein [Candidatus Babeliales bacterium]
MRKWLLLHSYTSDLEKRYAAHIEGIASKYTRSFKPVSIAQSWKITGGKSLAMKIENHIKKLSRIQKENLIVNPNLLFLENEIMFNC